jgi:hypothetical protein
MTAADRAKAAELFLAARRDHDWLYAEDRIAAALADARAEGEAAADQRWVNAVEGLAEEWDREAWRWTNVRTARLAARRAAARLRGLVETA